MWVDEIAFVENSWYTRFLLPLQSISDRRFIYATTPPLAQSWFADTVDLVKEANKKNDWHFEFTSHSLSCDECSENGVGAQCVHHLHFVPVWKSLVKMSSLQRLVPASERTAFNTEVLGMEEQSSASYVDERLLTAVREAPRRGVDGPVERVWVAIDPASHRRSSMGIAAVTFGSNGEYVILGVASIQCSRPQLVQVQLLIKQFLVSRKAFHPSSRLGPRPHGTSLTRHTEQTSRTTRIVDQRADSNCRVQWIRDLLGKPCRDVPRVPTDSQRLYQKVGPGCRRQSCTPRSFTNTVCPAENSTSRQASECSQLTGPRSGASRI